MRTSKLATSRGREATPYPVHCAGPEHTRKFLKRPGARKTDKTGRVRRQWFKAL
jgi:hypothetical protein